MITVLVTGARGQLGQCIQKIAHQFSTLHFIFVDKNKLDITNTNDVLVFFEAHPIDWCINCAAYTAVDNAENDQKNAYKINSLGAKKIAQACQKYGVKMIHISTDFVFDGLKTTPYKETDAVNPQSVYGASKLEGEIAIKTYCPSHLIIRTSWLYSEFGHNFLKTMLRLSSERNTLAVVSDQIGSPTYAVDLAEVLLQMILDNKTNYGTFHYANQGELSWFDLAKAIFDCTENTVILEQILTRNYVNLAKRPPYSVLNTSKICEEYHLKIPFWKHSLIKALSQVKNN